MDLDFQFTCDACGQLVTVSEDLVGHTVNCPNPMCGQRLSVPSAPKPMPGFATKPCSSDIEFPCPLCSHLLVVDTMGAGKRVACPECGKSITVPKAVTRAAPILAPPPAPAQAFASAPLARATSSVNLNAPAADNSAVRHVAHAFAPRDRDCSRGSALPLKRCAAWAAAIVSAGLVVAALSACLLHVLPSLTERLKGPQHRTPLSSAEEHRSTQEDAAQRDARVLAEYTQSALKGDAQAQNILGFLHQKTQNYTEAAKWYRKAAEQGDPCGQNNLGELYANGLGVVKNLKTAYGWHLLAGASGKANAERLLPKLTSGQIQEAHSWAKSWQPVVAIASEESPGDSGSAKAGTPRDQPQDDAARPGPAAERDTPKSPSELAREAIAREREQAAAREREAFNQLLAEAEQAEKDEAFDAAQRLYRRAVVRASNAVERIQIQESVKRVTCRIEQQKKQAAFSDLMLQAREAEQKEDWQSARAIYIEALAAAPDEKQAAGVRMCGVRVTARIAEQLKKNPPVNQTVLLGLVSKRVIEARRQQTSPLFDAAKNLVGRASITSNNLDPFESVTIVFNGREKASRVCAFTLKDSVGTTKTGEADGLSFTCLLTDLKSWRNGSDGQFIRTIAVRVTATRDGG